MTTIDFTNQLSNSYFALSQWTHFSPAVGFALPRVFSTLPARKVAKELSGHESSLKI
jgi:hypothetical protein